jgi:hypothetical protein
MEIYKNLPTEMQSIVRQYFRPVHPCAQIINQEFFRFFSDFEYFAGWDELTENGIDISDMIMLTYF